MNKIENFDFTEKSWIPNDITRVALNGWKIETPQGKSISLHDLTKIRFACSDNEEKLSATTRRMNLTDIVKYYYTITKDKSDVPDFLIEKKKDDTFEKDRIIYRALVELYDYCKRYLKDEAERAEQKLRYQNQKAMLERKLQELNEQALESSMEGVTVSDVKKMLRILKEQEFSGASETTFRHVSGDDIISEETDKEISELIDSPDGSDDE